MLFSSRTTVLNSKSKHYLGSTCSSSFRWLETDLSGRVILPTWSYVSLPARLTEPPTAPRPALGIMQTADQRRPATASRPASTRPGPRHTPSAGQLGVTQRKSRESRPAEAGPAGMRVLFSGLTTKVKHLTSDSVFP